MVHLQWTSSIDDHTIVIYSDGSKLEGKHTGAGWASFYVQNGQLHLTPSGACYLGTQAGVYDAGPRAVHEALPYPLTSEVTPGTAIICIDNSSVVDTLLYNKENSEPARLLSKQQMLSV
jgi:hypothetical protein